MANVFLLFNDRAEAAALADLCCELGHVPTQAYSMEFAVSLLDDLERAFDLVVAQRHLLDGYISDHIDRYRPHVPVVVTDRPISSYDPGFRCMRNCIIGLTEPQFLRYLALKRGVIRPSDPCSWERLGVVLTSLI